MSMGTRITALLVIGAVALLGACNDNNGTAVVTVTGNFQVLVGTTSQLTAHTVNASDSSYTWTSSDDTVAQVSATGLVTGMAPGQAVITARGSSSGASGSIGIVVPADVTDPTGLPQVAEWAGSGHADQTAEAFHHWDSEGEVPTTCAKCHSTPGYRDFLGDDGSTVRVVDQPAEIGTTVECYACHNPSAILWDAVIFPSGVEEKNLGAQARCMECHQGRSSKKDVDDRIANAGVTNDEDVISSDLGFINVHYFPAGATRYGGRVMGGYLYDGKRYDTLFEHVPGLDTCNSCHNPHTLEVRLDVCAKCHDVTTLDDLHDIRMASSLTRDYDGDGNLTEGIWFEVQGLRAKLLTALQRYCQEITGVCIAYDANAYPYFYVDTNCNGIVDEGETGRYNKWTARTVKASYNYQFATKDPGGFAHNAKFIIQLLYDSIEDLNSAISNPVDMVDAVRTDGGHFDGTAEPFRHWDAGGEVEAACAKCHSASPGFKEWLTYEANTPQEISNGFDCEVCHVTFDTFQTRYVSSVLFQASGYRTPDLTGAAVNDQAVMSNICISCHQGRAAKKTIDDVIASGNLSFQNVHYLAAAATLFGSDAQVGYEYDGKQYSGKFPHSVEFGNNNCTQCHTPRISQHTFLPDDNISYCRGCHTGVTDVEEIRVNSNEDYNGNGTVLESLHDELAGLSAALYAEIRAAADDNGTPIFYDANVYPYFFKDNGAGANFGNRFTAWTPALLKASHNYQHSQKEPGAWAHNFAYIAQLVIDSIEDLGGDVSGFVRPPVKY